MSLMKLVENSNLDNLYSKSECHVVLKAYSMSSYTTAVDILLLKLRVTWSVSPTYRSVVL
jgi:Na+-transporting NADH:ubiquinone oxidoreductase subunit NqrF